MNTNELRPLESSHLKCYQLIKLHLGCRRLIKPVTCYSFWTNEVTQQGTGRLVRRRHGSLVGSQASAKVLGIFINQNFRNATILSTVKQGQIQLLSKIIAKPAGTLEFLVSNTIIPSITEDGSRQHGGAVLGGFSRGRKGSEGISHCSLGLGWGRPTEQSRSDKILAEKMTPDSEVICPAPTEAGRRCGCVLPPSYLVNYWKKENSLMSSQPVASTLPACPPVCGASSHPLYCGWKHWQLVLQCLGSITTL